MSTTWRRMALTAVCWLAWPAVAGAGSWAVPGADPDVRPRLLFGPDEVDGLRQRLERPPYDRIYLGLFERAGREHDLDDHGTSAEQRKANTAMAAAFVYALDRAAREQDAAVVVEPFAAAAERAAYGQRAETLLAHMIDHCRMVDYRTGADDIHCAQELTLYATAYDLLAGAGYPFADEQAVVDRLAGHAADFFYKWTVAYWPTLTRSANENHGAKTASAIGLAAIALNGCSFGPGGELAAYRDPAAWIDFGMARGVSLGLEALHSAAGAYGEGPTYHRYAAINTEPFFWAWHRYTGGADWTVDGVVYPDPWTHPAHDRIHRWLLAVSMPDGTFPPFDDGTPGVTHFWGPFVGLAGGPAYRWAWERGVRPYDTSGSVDMAPLTLVAYDDGVAAAAPDFGPSVFMPRGGQAVFRSDWSAEAIYLILQAEHGVAGGWAFRHDGEWLEGAGGHEHSDPGTTHLMAFGERLLIDCGYLGWENHDRVRRAADHNILLVDGRGPQLPQLSVPPFTIVDGGVVIEDPAREGGWIPGEDAAARLRQIVTGEHLEHVRVDARYFAEAPACDWQRRLVFVDGRYFVQADVAQADDGLEHDFELLFHSNGGGSSGGAFERLQTGARVVRDGARLELRTAAAGGPLQLDDSLAEHDAWRWREETHRVLHAGRRAPALAVLTLLLPLRPEDETPAVERLAAGAGLAAFRVTAAGRSERIGLAAVGSAGGQVAGMTFSGGFALASAPEAGAADRLLLGDGRAIAADGLALQLDAPGSLVLERDGDALRGHYAGPANRLRISGAGALRATAGLCSEASEGDALVVELAGDGAFALAPAGQAGDRSPKAWAALAAEAVVGQPVVLDGSASCDADGDALAYAWSLLQAPVRSRAAIADAGAVEALLVPDVPGAYRIGLRVSAAGAASEQHAVWQWVERAPADGGDGGPDGGGTDGGESAAGGGGCGCAAAPAAAGPAALLLLFGLLGLRASRRSP